jgi:hypothetical protein
MAVNNSKLRNDAIRGRILVLVAPVAPFQLLPEGRFKINT